MQVTHGQLMNPLNQGSVAGAGAGAAAPPGGIQKLILPKETKYQQISSKGFKAADYIHLSMNIV